MYYKTQMKRVHIMALVILGFFFMPGTTFACGSHSEKNSCKKETSANTENRDCCKKDTHSKNNDNEGCDGKCGHSNCVTTSIHFCLTFFDVKFKNNNFDFTEINQNYFNSETNLSSGFYSIWLIPKIS